MARSIDKVNALFVKTVKDRGYYSDGGGLYLQVSKTETKSWIFRYRVGDKLHDMGLGSVRDYTLKEARDAARECRRLRQQKKDPLALKRAQQQPAKAEAAKAMTFEECARAYHTAHKIGWSAKHSTQWLVTLETYAYR